MTHMTLSCSCGSVQGIAENISPTAGNHLICYCEDCQQFAEKLGKKELLDEHGGSEIFQLPPNKLKITHGKDQLRCLKLTPKGPTRWYADCCKTPVANSFSAGLPMVGLIAPFIAPEADKSALGEVKFYVQGQHAEGKPPYENIHPKFPLQLIAIILCQALWGKVLGRNKPSPFYKADGQPVSSPEILY